MNEIQQQISDPTSHGLNQQIPLGNLNEMDGKYLTFWIDNQLFGVPIADVVQIVGVQEITSVPDFPVYAKGIINIRGSIIPVIDVRIRFHRQEIPYNEKTCIIVTNIQEKLVGFIVDSVDEVAKIETGNISITPELSTINTDAYLTGIAKLGNAMVLLVDPEKMLSNEEFSDIAKDNNLGGM